MKRKIPAGSELKRWFTTQMIEPRDFSSFVNMVRHFQSGLSRPRHAESSKRVADEFGAADAGEEEEWGDDWGVEPANRLNDVRQADGALKASGGLLVAKGLEGPRHPLAVWPLAILVVDVM